MPSFSWWALPLPQFGEYINRKAYYDLVYLAPYCMAGFVMTLTGLGITPLILRQRQGPWLKDFGRAAGITLLLLMLFALASDVASLAGAWRGTILLIHGDYDRYDIWALCHAFLPASILAGVARVGRRRSKL